MASLTKESVLTIMEQATNTRTKGLEACKRNDVINGAAYYGHMIGLKNAVGALTAGTGYEQDQQANLVVVLSTWEQGLQVALLEAADRIAPPGRKAVHLRLGE